MFPLILCPITRARLTVQTMPRASGSIRSPAHHLSVTLDSSAAALLVSVQRHVAEMVSEMRAYFDGLPARLDVRVVILPGEGRMFCAGADLGSIAFAEAGEGRAQRQMAMQKLY
jgi:hypothetical protein